MLKKILESGHDPCGRKYTTSTSARRRRSIAPRADGERAQALGQETEDEAAHHRAASVPLPPVTTMITIVTV